MKPTQVMIVEDEAIIGIFIRENLINFGYQVVGISSSGEEAINEAMITQPEIILMDIQLNGELNGIETAKRIKENLDIPVIYLTAFSDDKTIQNALEASPSGYLLKPFIPRELHTSIQTALHKKAEILTDQKRNNLLSKFSTAQTHNFEYPHLRIERKINRLKYIRDIIRKRRNYEKLIQKTNHYQDHLEALIGGLLFTQSIDEMTPLILPLKELAPSLEYSKDEIHRMGNLVIPLLIHTEDFESIDNYFKTILNNPGRSYEIEIRLKHKSGIFRNFSFKGIFQSKEIGKGVIIHVANDITWLKNLEYVSHIAREKFAAISNNPYFGIAILDKDAKILSINPTIEILTGYTKDDLNWLHFTDFIGTKELRYICQGFEKLKSNQVECFQAEAFIHTKNKGAFWCYLVFNGVYNEEKNLDRILCTLVDISESKLFGKKESFIEN